VRLLRYGCLLCLCCWSILAGAATSSKVALVIGNSKYETNSLANPVNDAQDMAKMLASYGFEVVGYNVSSGRLNTLDLDFAQMESYVSAFRRQLKPGGVALFYYAGHGIQKDGANYLIPINSGVDSAEKLKYKTLNAQAVLDEMEAAQSFLNVVILDACRDNPFRSFRSGRSGLAGMSAPAGSIVLFATQEGGTASDISPNGRNGLFTNHLLNAMQNKNMTIESIFKATSKQVTADARGYSLKQTPFLSSSFTEEFCFGLCDSKGEATDEVANLRKEVDRLKQQKSLVPAAPAPSSRASFEPEMVKIPAGTFEMGSNDYNNEKPVHSVSVNGFYMSKYETTFEEYDVFASATGRSKPSDEGWGRGKRPVINVRWEDAVAYAEWLSGKTGKTYRLPTEAEWEYAGRGGSTTKYWWGDNIRSNKANCDGCGSQWDNKQTAPVGSFSPNGFGLYDTVGNVWEWTCSEWGFYSDKKETVCNQSVTGWRVFRGGSWGNRGDDVRSAHRNGSDTSNRGYSIGFRLISVP